MPPESPAPAVMDVTVPPALLSAPSAQWPLASTFSTCPVTGVDATASGVPASPVTVAAPNVPPRSPPGAGRSESASAPVVQPPPPSPRKNAVPLDAARPVPPFAAPTVPSVSVGAVVAFATDSGALAATLVTVPGLTRSGDGRHSIDAPSYFSTCPSVGAAPATGVPCSPAAVVALVATRAYGTEPTRCRGVSATPPIASSR